MSATGYWAGREAFGDLQPQIGEQSFTHLTTSTPAPVTLEDTLRHVHEQLAEALAELNELDPIRPSKNDPLARGGQPEQDMPSGAIALASLLETMAHAVRQRLVEIHARVGRL